MSDTGIKCCCSVQLDNESSCRICKGHAKTAPHVNCIIRITQSRIKETFPATAEEHMNMATELFNIVYESYTQPATDEMALTIAQMATTAGAHAAMATAMWTKEMLDDLRALNAPELANARGTS